MKSYVFCFLMLLKSNLIFANNYMLRVPTFESKPKFYKKNGKVIGLCIDVLSEIEKVEPKLKFTGMDEQISIVQIEQMVTDGEADIFLCNGETERRNVKLKKVNVPIFQAQSVLVARSEDAVEIKNIQDLQKLYPNNLVLSWKGTEQNDWILKKSKVMTDSGISGTNNMERLFQMLLTNRGRFLFVQKYTAINSIKELSLEKKVKILHPPLSVSNRYIWVSRKVPLEAVNLIEKALNKLKAKKILHELAKKYDID
ncbi:transporter substrate-binding domain-containing protein [Pigmentibacter sp. JX0631]|uniref:substrate-binding periplasmic protein n=1 Tax=Pigmentibacter sp. JX0631 TaxID=2976982 RepID=UPI0024698A6C|nr:transporter substrate-binding domain-containing protein [Pigmentibacter sp. JX0631]WGL59395.1 transporter substrate-binding domain-containing protein [Pigmentibacter sp. JX0631]